MIWFLRKLDFQKRTENTCCIFNVILCGNKILSPETAIPCMVWSSIDTESETDCNSMHAYTLIQVCNCLYDEVYWAKVRYVELHTVEPRYNEVLGTMKITLLYQVSHYIRVKKQRNIKNWDQQNYLVIRGFCYIRPLYNEVPLYKETNLHQ